MDYIYERGMEIGKGMLRDEPGRTEACDAGFMRRALELAEKGRGFVSPNPMVGAVIVKAGRRIGEGWHECWGDPHAERNALAACTEDPAGSVMYVTLEPCCHHGKTPPCTEAILEAGIRRVVIGSADPNPRVAGKGVELLRSGGIEVDMAPADTELGEACRRLNRIFFHWIEEGRPYLAMKYAMTADGKLAARTGESRWITGEAAREHVHGLRHRYSGIMVGIGTVLKDDPMLDCRIPGGKNPVRIICDSGLRIPVDSRICRTAGEIPTIVAACREPSGSAVPVGAVGAELQLSTEFEERKRRLEGMEIEVIQVDEKAGRLDLDELMEALGRRGIDSILLEGGGSLNYSALEQGIVRHLYVYMGAKLFGGAAAKTPVEGRGVDLPSQAFRLERPEVQVFGDDLLIEYDVKAAAVEHPPGEKPGGNRCLQE